MADITGLCSPLSPSGVECTLHSPRIVAAQCTVNGAVIGGSVRSLVQREDSCVQCAAFGVVAQGMVEVMDGASEDGDNVNVSESHDCDMESESIEDLQEQQRVVLFDQHEARGVTFAWNHEGDTAQKRIIRRDTPTTLAVRATNKTVPRNCMRMWQAWRSNRSVPSMVPGLFRRVKSGRR